jgi:type IV pilus assembly protein PilZ
MNGDSDDERRRENRAPIELKVEYKRLNTFFYDYTKNISRGGTFIKTDRPLDIGTLFVFKLRVPGAEEPIELHGEVRWVVRAGQPISPSPGEGQDAGMGIRFVYDVPEQRSSFERQVEKMMVGSLGQLIYAHLVSREP